MKNVKKVWERRFHAFPPHYTPADTIIQKRIPVIAVKDIECRNIG